MVVIITLNGRHKMLHAISAQEVTVEIGGRVAVNCSRNTAVTEAVTGITYLNGYLILQPSLCLRKSIE